MASFRKLDNGKFQGTIYFARDNNGKQLRKYITRIKLKDCKTAAREIEQEYEDGLFVNIKTMRFAKWADEWIKLNKSRLSPSTMQSYNIYVDKHFKPYFLNLKVSQINEIMIKRYISNKLEILSSTTVRKHIYILSSILKDVMKHKNPCKYIDIPPIAPYDYHIVTDDEYKQVREFYRGKYYEPIILLAALCGIRRGEIFALKWNDIDTVNQTIRIDQALCISEEEKGYIEKTTKSANGIRTITAPIEIFELLEVRHKKLLKATIAKNKTIQERIFTTRPDSLSGWFAECMDKLQLDIRFHDLRHYHATWLYKNGIPDLFAAERLGDDLQTIKKIYQHIGEDTARKINDEIIKKINNI